MVEPSQGPAPPCKVAGVPMNLITPPDPSDREEAEIRAMLFGCAAGVVVVSVLVLILLVIKGIEI